MSYVVQTGETISAVSKKLKTSFQALKRQNPDAFAQTKDGRWYLKAGFKLQTEGPTQTQTAPISTSTSSYQPTRTTNTNTTSGTASDKTYTVQQGDTIKAVSDKLGFTFQDIKAANPSAVGSMQDGRQFFYAGASLKMPGGFQKHLQAAQQSASPPAVTAMKASSTNPVIRRPSSEPVAAADNYPRSVTASQTSQNGGMETRTPTVSSYQTAYNTTSSVDSLESLPYRSPGIVKASNDTFRQNPVIGTSDFTQVGQHSLSQSNYVLEAPLDKDLNLAFGIVTERHDTEDFSHSREGLDNKGVTMGLRFRF